MMALAEVDNALVRLAGFRPWQPAAHSPDRGIFVRQLINVATAHIGADQVSKLRSYKAEGCAALPVQFQN